MSAQTRKRYEETIEAALEGTTRILERFIPGVEESLKRTRQQEKVSISVTFTWKQDGEEGLVLEVAGKPAFAPERKTYKASLEGGQLSLFKAPKV